MDKHKTRISKRTGEVSGLNRVRLDKWLWAARFYKTRSIAKQAIEGGKVRCENNRAKPGKEIEIGMEISLRQGFDEKTVVVRALSDRRRGAPEAQLLYTETIASIDRKSTRLNSSHALNSYAVFCLKKKKKKKKK